MTEGNKAGFIDRQIMWNRLLAVVEEQAQVLQSTAFSTVVRESGDLAAGVFDAKGRMLAQAVTGTPGHINSMALAVGHVIDHHPLHTMKPGDVFIHNDPWMGTGHTNDISLTTPCFLGDRLVGFLACNCHVMDIGGVLDLSKSTDVFMEGLYLPILRIFEQGKVNETLMAIIRANTREPVETVGDVYSMVNCNHIGCDRLREMMAEFGLSDIDDLAEYIVETSRLGVLKKIAALPKGTWHSTLTLDGFDEPLILKAALTISDEGIHVDYTGTAPMTKRSFNVPLCYTLAYTSYALGIAIVRDIPNNHGSLAPRTVHAPPGCILNATKPAAVITRSFVGLFLPDLVFNCLRQALPEMIPAESTCGLWEVRAMGPWDTPPRNTHMYHVRLMTTGGMGALPYRDGMSATGFPSGVRGGPVEIFESMSTLVFWRKELRVDSGGPGEFRGGLGQDMEISNILPEDFLFFAGLDRIDFPPRGIHGGLDGTAGRLALASGAALPSKGMHTIPAGDRLIIQSSGGGGAGDPKSRDRAMVAKDLRDGMIHARTAREIYGYEPEDAE